MQPQGTKVPLSHRRREHLVGHARPQSLESTALYVGLAKRAPRSTRFRRMRCKFVDGAQRTYRPSRPLTSAMNWARRNEAATQQKPQLRRVEPPSRRHYILLARL
jgi:hypothetical protein